MSNCSQLFIIFVNEYFRSRVALSIDHTQLVFETDPQSIAKCSVSVTNTGTKVMSNHSSVLITPFTVY